MSEDNQDNVPQWLTDKVDSSKGLMPLSDLTAASERMGVIEEIEIRAENWVKAQEELGGRLKEQIQRTVNNKLDKEPEVLRAGLDLAKKSRMYLESEINEGGEKGKEAGDYRDCMIAWAKGAGLREMVDKVKKTANTEELDELDIGLWLQNDNVGCQTAIFRTEAGEILLIHTEEDNTGSVDKPRLAKFLIGGAETTAFVYPSLLPGPAFGWSQSEGEYYFQALDFLYLRATDGQASLANMVAFLALKNGKYDEVEKIIKRHAPYVDGYAMNLVEINRGISEDRVKAMRIVFAKNRTNTKELDKELVQVNIFGSEDQEMVDGIEDIHPKQRRLYEERISRIKRMWQLTGRIVKKADSPVDALTRLLGFRIGGAYAMANPDVLAALAMRISPKGEMEGRIMAGPVVKSRNQKQGAVNISFSI